jgi:Tfp pilus assembly protein PilO
MSDTTRYSRYSRTYKYIEPALRNPLVRTYGYIIFTIIATILFIIYAIKPTIETIVVLQKQLSDQKIILTKLTQKSQALSQARENYQAIPDGKKQALEQSIPKQINLPFLVTALENSTLSTTASISALQFQPVTIEKPQNSQTLSEVQFTFNTEGSLTDLKHILTNLRKSPRMIAIDTLIFNRVEGGNTILMSITGRGFYLK